MSIVVRIPEEIEDYKESIIMGLSVRQLACSAVALACGVPTYMLISRFNENVAVYAAMLVIVPAFCVGFVKVQGYRFEKYAAIVFKSLFTSSKRSYLIQDENTVFPTEILEYKDVNITLEEDTDNAVKQKTTKRKKRAAKSESSLVEITKKGSERKRKTALAAIKAARGRITYTEREKEKTA